MNKIVNLLMHLQTKVNDELEIMIKDEYYGPSRFTLDGYWNDLEYIISFLIAYEELSVPSRSPEESV